MEILETEALAVGLGAMGSAALYHLSRAGVDTVGIEQFPVGHDPVSYTHLTLPTKA